MKTKARKSAKRKAVVADVKAAPTKTVLVLRTCKADMSSTNGFAWPKSGPVECKDWKDNNKCGNGLHGLLWGEGGSGYLNWNEEAKWLVVSVAESDLRTGNGDLTDKCKFPRGVVVFSGDRIGATNFIRDNGGAGKRIHGGTATAGDSGTATAGDSGTATAGDSGIIVIEHYDPAISSYRRIVGVVGENGIKANTKYRVGDKMKLAEVKP